MSQVSIINNKVHPSFSAVDSLTGNAGGVITPDVYNNINIVGGLNITTTGTPLNNTITINLNPSIAVTGSITAGTDITATNGSLTAGSTDNDALPAGLVFNKYRGVGAVHTGDYLGIISFQGFDGAALVAGAYIISQTSGTIAAGRIPANLSFWTHPDSAGGALQRLTIAPNGGVTINTFGIGVVLSDTTGLLSSLTPGIPGTVLMSNGATHAPSWQVASEIWQDVGAGAYTIVSNIGYFASTVPLVTFLLPATANTGDFTEIVGVGANWVISQNAGQWIQYGNLSTTVGVGGSISSTNSHDTIRIVCLRNGLTVRWYVTSAVGILNVV